MDRPDTRERITNDLVISPAEDELAAIAKLAQHLRTADDVTIQYDGSAPVPLPESLKDGIARLAVYMAGDMTVAIKPYEEVVTTQQAANLLSISRPYLIRLIEHEHAIAYQPGDRPGRHRRLKLSDVLEYRDKRNRAAIRSVSDELEPLPTSQRAAASASAGS
jgi:excisionase family DNA binding protein